MPVIIEEADGDAYRCPDVEERLILLPVEDGEAPWEMLMLCQRLDVSTWLISDVFGGLTREVLVELEYVPIEPGAPIPAACRPCYCFDAVPSADFLTGVRRQAENMRLIEELIDEDREFEMGTSNQMPGGLV